MFQPDSHSTQYSEDEMDTGRKLKHLTSRTGS